MTMRWEFESAEVLELERYYYDHGSLIAFVSLDEDLKVEHCRAWLYRKEPLSLLWTERFTPGVQALISTTKTLLTKHCNRTLWIHEQELLDLRPICQSKEVTVPVDNCTSRHFDTYTD